MKREKRKTKVLIITMLVMVLMVTNVHAYVRYDLGYHLAPVFSVQYSGYVKTQYKIEFEDAIDSWNNSSNANITFFKWK